MAESKYIPIFNSKASTNSLPSGPLGKAIHLHEPFHLLNHYKLALIKTGARRRT
jgi:hypothetical protein